jgi:DMSO/TMAO reductase YedYZ molybdopterin-dependent catalytic subunit
MHRREALLGSGVVLAAVAALPATAVESSATGAYDISLGVEPAKGGDEFLCRVSLRPAESGRIHQSEHAFKRGTNATMRMGEGRPDGSAIELLVEVTVDASGTSAAFVATITDRNKIVSVQRTSVALPRA